MRKRNEKKTESRRVFGMPLGESTINAIRQRALNEKIALGEHRTMAAVCTDALLNYLATPLPRQKSA
jgi:hypothetical protein